MYSRRQMKSRFSLSVVVGSRQAENAFQYVVAMETALFSVHVQNPAFAFGQVRPIVQDLPARQRRGDDGRDVERLFAFALPVEALKLPSVAMVELSIHIIWGGVS